MNVADDISPGWLAVTSHLPHLSLKSIPAWLLVVSDDSHVRYLPAVICRRSSKSRRPSSGGAALVKLARVPLFVSAARVNWGTSRTPPPMSWTERFILPASSANTR